MRLKLKLQEFDYTIVYKKGKENGNSDGLSRMFSEAVSDRAIINALTGEAEEVGMKPDREELLRETVKVKMSQRLYVDT